MQSRSYLPCDLNCISHAISDAISLRLRWLLLRQVMPRWAWAIILSLVVNLVVQRTMHYGYVVNVTDLFLRSAAAAVVCLQQLTVFHYEQAAGSREQQDADAGAAPFVLSKWPLLSPLPSSLILPSSVGSRGVGGGGRAGGRGACEPRSQRERGKHEPRRK